MKKVWIYILLAISLALNVVLTGLLFSNKKSNEASAENVELVNESSASNNIVDEELISKIQNANSIALCCEYDPETGGSYNGVYSVANWGDGVGHFQNSGQEGKYSINCDVSEEVLAELKKMILESDYKEYKSPVDENGLIMYETLPKVLVISWSYSANDKPILITECSKLDEITQKFEGIQHSAAERINAEKNKGE